MRISGFVIGLLMFAVPLARAAEGLVELPSAHSVPVTVDRLEAALEAQGFRIFARIDHGAGAASVDMALPPTQLLIFGKPQAGTVLMQAGQTMGIDLPLKYLVWQDADGTVTVGWNDIVFLAERHGIDSGAAVLQNIAAALRRFASEASQ